MAALDLQFEAIGTGWTIAAEGLGNAGEAEEKIRLRIAEYDKNYSRFRADSLVTEMSQTAGTYQLPADAQPLFDLYNQAYDLTQGTVTPLIGQMLSDAGYDAVYSLQPGPLTPPPTWEEALDYAYPVLTIHKPVLLDLGAAGKGYLVDIIHGLLHELGASSSVINAGGDIRVHNKEIRIGLEDPSMPDQVIGIATVQQGSICGSSGSRRQWAEYTHIIHPSSQASPIEIVATWAFAPTALVADMMTTCAFFGYAKEFAAHTSAEYLSMNADRSVQVSDHFPAELFTTP